MTTINTDYNNTELLDQELTIEELEAVAGGADVMEGEDDSWWLKRYGPKRYLDGRKTPWA